MKILKTANYEKLAQQSLMEEMNRRLPVRESRDENGELYQYTAKDLLKKVPDANINDVSEYLASVPPTYHYNSFQDLVSDFSINMRDQGNQESSLDGYERCSICNKVKHSETEMDLNSEIPNICKECTEEDEMNQRIGRDFVDSGENLGYPELGGDAGRFGKNNKIIRTANHKKIK